MDDQAPGTVCPVCAGSWVDGRISVPIVGALRFVYRLGTNEVTTEVVARMCEDCGHVDLHARDPELIVRARRAATQGRTRLRWTPTARPAPRKA